MKQGIVLKMFVSLVVAVVLTLAATQGWAIIVPTAAGNNTGFIVSNTDLVNQGQTASLASASYSGYVDEFGFGTPALLNDGQYGGPIVGAGDDASYQVSYALTSGTFGSGWDINKIQVTSGYGNPQRSGVSFTLQYDTFTDPTLTTLGTWTLGDGGFTATQLTLTDLSGGALSSNLGQLRSVKDLVFTLGFNPTSGQSPIYREIDVFGTASIPEPSMLFLLGVGGLVAWRCRRLGC